MNLNFLENKYFLAIFAILSGFYGAQLRPTLPNFIMDLFQNPFFRVLILCLVVIKSYTDISFSIIIAILFLLVMNKVNEKLFENAFTNTINTDNLEQICNNIFLDKETIIGCINTINNYTPNLNDRDTNYEKLSCLNNVNYEKLSTICKEIPKPLSKDQNVNCVEKYKLKPTYNVPDINGDCSKLL